MCVYICIHVYIHTNIHAYMCLWPWPPSNGPFLKVYSIFNWGKPSMDTKKQNKTRRKPKQNFKVVL